MPRDIVPVPHAAAARAAGLPQRQEEPRVQDAALRAVRHRGEGGAER